MTVSPATLPRMTLDEYLAYEHSQEIRHEFVDGYLYAMTGASERHERIAMNLALAPGNHRRGSPCRVFKGGLKLAVGEDHYYPDLFVACGEPRPEGCSRDDPVLIDARAHADQRALVARHGGPEAAARPGASGATPPPAFGR